MEQQLSLRDTHALAAANQSESMDPQSLAEGHLSTQTEGHQHYTIIEQP